MTDTDKLIADLRAENARLREALQPFLAFWSKAMEGFSQGWESRHKGQHVCGWNYACLYTDDFINAREALAQQVTA